MQIDQMSEGEEQAGRQWHSATLSKGVQRVRLGGAHMKGLKARAHLHFVGIALEGFGGVPSGDAGL